MKKANKKLLSSSRSKKLDLNPAYIEMAKLLVNKNPEQISFSLAARKTKVPRSTLYYYFDSKIENLILESVRFNMKEFMQLWDNSPQTEKATFASWEEFQEYKFRRAIELVIQSPWTLQLYFRYCRHQSYVGNEIRYIEQSYLNSTERAWEQFHHQPMNDKQTILLAHLKLGVLWGLLDTKNSWLKNPTELANTCTSLFSSLLIMEERQQSLPQKRDNF